MSSDLDIQLADELPPGPSTVEEAGLEVEPSESNVDGAEFHLQEEPMPIATRGSSGMHFDNRIPQFAAFLCNPFETTITEQPIDYQDPECMEELKDAADTLVDAKAELFIKFSKHIGSCCTLFAKQIHDEFVKFLEITRNQPAKKNEAWERLSKTLNDMEILLGGGGSMIFRELENRIAEVQGSINSANYAIDSERRRDFIRKEDIQYYRGLLVAVKDDIVPKVSKPIDPTGLAKSLMKAAVNGLTYASLARKESQVKVIELQEKMYAEYRATILEANNKIRGYRSVVSNAADNWSNICNDWQTYCHDVRAAVLKRVSAVEMEEKLLVILYRMKKFFVLLKAPVADFLAQVSGSPVCERRISVNRQVAIFYKHVTSFAYLLTQLHTTKEIMHDQYQTGFTRDIYSLSEVISSYLGEFRELYNGYRSAADPGQQATFLTKKSWKFAQDTGHYI